MPRQGGGIARTHGIIHGSIGRVGFEADAIKANLEALRRSGWLPSSAKGVT